MDMCYVQSFLNSIHDTELGWMTIIFGLSYQLILFQNIIIMLLLLLIFHHAAACDPSLLEVISVGPHFGLDPVIHRPMWILFDCPQFSFIFALSK